MFVVASAGQHHRLAEGAAKSGLFAIGCLILSRCGSHVGMFPRAQVVCPSAAARGLPGAAPPRRPIAPRGAATTQVRPHRWRGVLTAAVCGFLVVRGRCCNRSARHACSCFLDPSASRSHHTNRQDTVQTWNTPNATCIATVSWSLMSGRLSCRIMTHYKELFAEAAKHLSSWSCACLPVNTMQGCGTQSTLPAAQGSQVCRRLAIHEQANSP